MQTYARITLPGQIVVKYFYLAVGMPIALEA